MIARAVTMFLLVAAFAVGEAAFAEIGVISPRQADERIEHSEVASEAIVSERCGGYKDDFRNHLPKADPIDFGILRGTDKHPAEAKVSLARSRGSAETVQ